jgi:hypothetical protein
MTADSPSADPMDDAGRWICHGGMTDPGRHRGGIAGLPSAVGQLNGVIQGLLVHSDWLASYGLDESHRVGDPRKTLSVADRLDDILARDGSPFGAARPPDRRGMGTCRDFALLLCSLLRCRGVPARVRCGFAAYFGDAWEDHWVCEYWNQRDAAWHLGDAQIDSMLKERCGISFDPADVPRGSFVTAGQAWLDCIEGRADADRFGHSNVQGLWFVAVNVWRDHYVLNGRATSAWDRWREAPLPDRVVRKGDVALLNRLALCPGQAIVEAVPDWLVRDRTWSGRS